MNKSIKNDPRRGAILNKSQSSCEFNEWHVNQLLIRAVVNERSCPGDMATQMSPVGSNYSSPTRKPPFPNSTPSTLPTVELHSVDSSKSETWSDYSNLVNSYACSEYSNLVNEEITGILNDLYADLSNEIEFEDFLKQPFKDGRVKLNTDGRSKGNPVSARVGSA
ncbi:hypothetical protein SADUNF_Sadunf05G0115100 [Salix dunnii]|uniref:Uncharacterized protein n=1 Tax=Salix dunnii TaxID=1413687 RepID=A0A835K831_9ROSI|nr:hypothetical protein SADUNF_Sadunf05G0115100 [Salix dunnii]